MRRYKQIQILELISSLKSAHVEINQFIRNDQLDEVAELLVLCQQAAMDIGNEIEKYESNTHDVITLLEEYCETLYHISTLLDLGPNIDKLNSLLENIELNIKNDISIKVEIVFFPYKASMWDSLESVWIAASKDERCECFVVPIPYYEINEKKELVNIHYEGDLFPDYVPIVPYTSYDLENRRPDIVYIHNPYDHHNKVTSVHPSFYSAELKKYTEMLVYLPYFVSMKDVPQYFCENMGIINADKVILQSESIKNTYLKTYQNLLKLKNYNNTKFIALGSPKIDKVIHSNSYNVNIPSKWKDKIRNKKVVLFNTHIDKWITSGDQIINKLYDVFDCVKKYKDIVLLWRPHPLSQESAKSLNPMMLDRINQLENEFIEENIGILDKTADLHRAIAISDAYMGDWSSLVPMYGVTGKPVLIQNIEMINSLNEEAKYAVGFEKYIKDGDCLWFSDSKFNGLYRANTHDNTIEFMGYFPNEKLEQRRLYSSCIKINDLLVFSPLAASEIAVFNIVGKCFTKIQLKEPKNINKVKYRNTSKFYELYSYKQWIYFFPSSYPAIVRYNIDTNEIQYFDEWINELDKLITDNDDVYFRTGYCAENTVVLPTCNANVIFEFDMELCTYQIHTVGGKYCSYSSICFDGKDYWLAPRNNGPVVKWNKPSNTYVEYKKFPKEYVPCKFSFMNIFYYDKFVWLIPHFSNSIIKVNIESGEMETYENLANSMMVSGYKFWLAQIDQSELYLCNYKDNQLIKLNLKTNKKEEIYFIITDKSVRKNRLQFISPLYTKKMESYLHPEDCNFYESDILSIEDYLEYIKEDREAINVHRSKLYRDLFLNSDGTCGEKVHEYMLNNIPRI